MSLFSRLWIIAVQILWLDVSVGTTAFSTNKSERFWIKPSFLSRIKIHSGIAAERKHKQQTSDVFGRTSSGLGSPPAAQPVVFLEISRRRRRGGRGAGKAAIGGGGALGTL